MNLSTCSSSSLGKAIVNLRFPIGGSICTVIGLFRTWHYRVGIYNAEVMATNVLKWIKSRQSYFLAAMLASVLPFTVRAQNQHAPKPTGAEAIPEPAIPAILAAFDKYEVVAMPEAHGLKDLDDFILTLIRTPAFTTKVNDIEVECGNSLYQPQLDQYIAGEDVPFVTVRKTWRNTSQPMCGLSGFFEQLFPL